MIDRYLLRYFLAVVEKGNFSRAAQHCRVSQPTLSVGISKLERELGRQLFARTNRRVALTEAGSRFAVHARRIETEFSEAARSVMEPEARTPVRLGVLASLPADWLSQGLGQLAGVQLELVEGRRADLVSLLDRARIDAVLTVVSAGAYGTMELFSEPYLLALPDGHPLASGDEIEVRELAAEGMLVRRHCEALPEVSAFFTGHGIRPPITARTTNDERALAYVRGGIGMTVMPACFTSPGVALRPLTGFTRTRTIGFQVTHDNKWMIGDGGPLEKAGSALLGIRGDAGADLAHTSLA